jgi:hypothetical protein
MNKFRGWTDKNGVMHVALLDSDGNTIRQINDISFGNNPDFIKRDSFVDFLVVKYIDVSDTVLNILTKWAHTIPSNWCISENEIDNLIHVYDIYGKLPDAYRTCLRNSFAETSGDLLSKVTVNEHCEEQINSEYVIRAYCTECKCTFEFSRYERRGTTRSAILFTSCTSCNRNVVFARTKE